jgi:hypothetical protein
MEDILMRHVRPSYTSYLCLKPLMTVEWTTENDRGTNYLSGTSFQL